MMGEKMQFYVPLKYKLWGGNAVSLNLHNDVLQFTVLRQLLDFKTYLICKNFAQLQMKQQFKKKVSYFLNNKKP